MVIEKKAHESQRDYARRYLEKKILLLEYEPNYKLSEIEISKRLQVSRTPIREALILLEAKGLVCIAPKKSSRVTRINIAHAEDTAYLRKAIESQVLKEASLNITETQLQNLREQLVMQQEYVDNPRESNEFYRLDNFFHETLYHVAGRHDLWMRVRELSSDYNRLRRLDSQKGISLQQIVYQHQKLLKVIEAKNFRDIEALLEIHLQNIFYKIKEIVEMYPEYFVIS